MQFVYRNPHSFVHVQAPDDRGRPAALGGRVERHRPARQGRRDSTTSLKVGDEVVIVGASLARAGRIPGADGQAEATDRRVHLGRTRAAKSLTRQSSGSVRSMMRGLGASARACCIAPAAARRSARRARRRRGGRASPRAGRGDRSHRLLGFGDHRRLEVPDGHAEEGRVRRPSAERRGPESRADSWDPAQRRSRRRAVPGLRRRQHHAPADTPEHHLGRTTTRCKIDTDAGTQTRRLHFGAAPAPAEQAGRAIRSRNGNARRRPRRRAQGTLKVVTTNLRPGYVRKNGAPHSDKAVVTEYYDINTLPNGDLWMTVTTKVDDPVYFTRPYLTTSDFKKLPDAAGWNPTPCSAR